MDLSDRIRRRREQSDVPQLVRNYSALSPVHHLDEPTGCGSVFERLLDHLDPIFDGSRPPNGYLYGPQGSGKSAVVTALVAHLNRFATETHSIIYTSTRRGTPAVPPFVYIDTREHTREFAFYRRILDEFTETQVPQQGIGTDELRRRLHEQINDSAAGVIVVVDHVGEPNSVSEDTVVEFFAGLPSNTSWLAVSRTPPAETPLTEYTATSIATSTYQLQALVDILMARASEGLARRGLPHKCARSLAEWADGNAHSALAALFVAADEANRNERMQISRPDITAATADVPDSPVSLGQVLALPANKQAVLRALVDLESTNYASVDETTNAISDVPTIDLSPGTIKRFIYELSEGGIIERVESTQGPNKGRPPSRVEVRFPSAAFRRLYDLQHRDDVL